jgi:hypothetical protein
MYGTIFKIAANNNNNNNNNVCRYRKALKHGMSEKGLNMDALSHPCDRVVPFILNIKKAAKLQPLSIIY